MNPERTQLKQEQRAEQASAHQQIQNTEQQSQAKEFASVDDLLRHDSEQNPVPPEVAERLGHSLESAAAGEPKATRPWYKKLFG